MLIQSAAADVSLREQHGSVFPTKSARIGCQHHTDSWWAEPASTAVDCGAQQQTPDLALPQHVMFSSTGGYAWRAWSAIRLEWAVTRTAAIFAKEKLGREVTHYSLAEMTCALGCYVFS